MGQDFGMSNINYFVLIVSLDIKLCLKVAECCDVVCKIWGEKYILVLRVNLEIVKFWDRPFISLLRFWTAIDIKSKFHKIVFQVRSFGNQLLLVMLSFERNLELSGKNFHDHSSLNVLFNKKVFLGIFANISAI